MKIQDSKISGCSIIQTDIFEDHRGFFNKPFTQQGFLRCGLDFFPAEFFYSTSAKYTLRGMHFQKDPHQIQKLIFCSTGSLLDVWLDLRKASPTYGLFDFTELSANSGKAVLIPEGIAHGFFCFQEGTTACYLQSGPFVSASDTGILWNSFGMDWPNEQPLLSKRDQSFVSFDDYNVS